jgi:cytochrome P450
MRAVQLPRLDLSDPAILVDPYPEYARLRAAGPLARGFGGQWVLTRHAEIDAVLRDRRLTKQVPLAYYGSLVGTGRSAEFLGRMQDLLENRRVTSLLVKAFNLKFTPRLADYAVEVADRLLTPLVEAGRFDAAADIGMRYPVEVVCELFGVPAERRETFRRCVADLVSAYSDSVIAADEAVVLARREAANEAVSWLQEYLSSVLDERRAGTAEDGVSALLAARDGGDPLPDQAVVDSVIMSCYAGFETAAAMLATGLTGLSTRPDEWARLRADPSLVRSAVEEFVRFDAPIQIGLRRVLEPMEIDGQKIRSGRILMLLLGSANRDERVFATPDTLDIGRRPNPHVSFGGGAYYCLGAALARLEGEVLLTRLAKRCATLEPAGPPVRRARFNFPTYTSMPLAVTPA